MTVALHERNLGSVRRIVVAGPRFEVFRALGAHLRAEIADILARLPALPRLRAYLATGTGARRFAAVRRASQQRTPREWAELAALAEGAGQSLDTLALLNFRGDLGDVNAAGCSDLCWRGDRTFLAHNEDGDAVFDGRWALVTFGIDGEPPVAAFWYPGFLGSNALALTGRGVLCSIDHLPVAEPFDGPGRHLVARAAQQADGVDAAVDYLTAHPSAGGFAYHLADRTGRIRSVEIAGGRSACVAPSAAEPLTWHTNHGRGLPGADAPPGGSSMRRGEVLAGLPVPDRPDAEWFRHVLADAPPPHGVRAEGESVTLATFVADLTAGELVMQPRGADPVTVSFDDLISL